MLGIQIPSKLAERQVPKHALTFEEVCFALGSEQLVADLRRIGALEPALRRRQTILFDAGAVARVWAEVRDGRYDEALRANDSRA